MDEHVRSKGSAAVSTRPLFDPEILPIESTGVDLPRVPEERLSIEGLKCQLSSVPAAQRVEFDCSPWCEPSDPRQAAVLIPLIPRPDGLSVLLTQRSANLSDHAGQISFPGGRTDPGDQDALATALREAHEEVDLAPERIEPLGTLPEYLTRTGYIVTPIVGLLHPPFHFCAAADEVAEIFEVPLAFLMNPAHHQVRCLRSEDGARRFFAIPYPRRNGAGSYFIWGATAGMLRNLYRLLLA